MINKEEIERRNIKIQLKNLAECIIDVLNENQRLEEINKEHQKINGNLQKRITELENILKGKAIHEMGTSNLYKENAN